MTDEHEVEAAEATAEAPAASSTQTLIELLRDDAARVQLAQSPAGADQGPGRAEAGHEVGHTAATLAPYLWPGGQVVCAPIGRVVVLISV